MKLSIGKAVWAIVSLATCASIANSQMPLKTSATYDNWTLACVQTDEKHKTCELIQLQTIPNEVGVASQITIRLSSGAKLLKVSMQVPASTWLATGVRLVRADSVISADFRWCIPERCLADGEIPISEVKALAEAESGKLIVKNAKQMDVV